MEALVLACAALVVLVLIGAGCWIAVSLMRWAPVLLVGAAIGWFAVHQGLATAETLITGLLVSLGARATYTSAQMGNE